jgi:hypothetical protein
MIDIITQINGLPCEIKNIIFDLLPNNQKIFLNKRYYKKFHYLIRNIIINHGTYNGVESYIRYIIRNDYYFPFERLIEENFNKWLYMKRYAYKDMIFPSYIKFLIYYCTEFGSSACLNKLITNENYIKLFGIFKKEHKNIINTSIRWIN